MPQMMKPSEPRTCEHCGATMTRPARMPLSLWAKRRWCNKTCMAAARAPKEVACERCGMMFRPAFTRKRGHKFCSLLCANAGKPIKGPYRKVRDGEKVRSAHRVVKEKELGRPLLPTEIVHHEDENKQNNDPGNLDLMNNSDHSRMHMKGNQNARRFRP